jgi:hypothetical protein
MANMAAGQAVFVVRVEGLPLVGLAGNSITLVATKTFTKVNAPPPGG